MTRGIPNTIIIDFDGTLCKFAFPEVGEPQPNVKEGLEKLHNAGYKIVIHSVRTATYLNEDTLEHVKAIKNFMLKNNLYYDEILLTCDKPIAAAYIDDRGIGYRGDWLKTVNETLKLLEQLK